jgi:ornithine cyclodeaminase/alanine dehydrogenase
MPASLPERGYLGFKAYTASKAGARFWFYLLDGTSGELLATMQADRLGQRRTGAASGVATKYLARKEAATVGLVGTGWQARSQLEAICSVRPVERVRCYGRDRGRREAFASERSVALGVDVVAVESSEDAVRGSDIVVAATTAREPVVLGSWLDAGVHINAMGANRLDARELDDAVISRANFIAADSREQAQIEAGDLAAPVSRGILQWDEVHELADVVSGRATGRRGPEDITLFKSLGIALEDVAVGALVYERARKEGIGRELAL